MPEWPYPPCAFCGIEGPDDDGAALLLLADHRYACESCVKEHDLVVVEQEEQTDAA